ncbi:hypothetical protein K435DRAFT_735450 [Dendrothele bispora CBS 962.96]|uniref:Thioredoxin domain-containing protein n=1 Tax=Dendrothele bispora (strain CBS 962.96) TaxID=1314807 RepID=A0A4S8KZI6_DENBC|nr:hypothetical protein K435DRAFT_735450 [Dendrothele bispora CBS 962.96]
MAERTPNLALGSIAPNFEAHTSAGPIRFHKWTGDSWSILFSHPGTSFPTDLAEVARRLPEIEKRQPKIKLIGVSRNWAEDCKQWATSQQMYGRKPGVMDHLVQIVADDGSELSSLYGMLNDRKNPKPTTAYVVDSKKTIRYVLSYPSSIGTRLYQIIRFIDENSGHLDGINHDQFELNSHGQGTIYKEAKSSSFDAVGAVMTATAAAETVQGSNITSTVSNVASTVLGGTGADTYIKNALQVLESVTEVGKVVPFVAPAFVILKVIISIEQKARDVDAKCQDLVQRVTFMLSHLPALKNIKVMDSTRQVIDHMNDVLKQCASLIEAYRKQGAVAKRLSLHNKDKFAGCAKALSDCTNDLMVSLQIHQSTRLDILTRGIPDDPEDEAAKKFVDAHGGLEAVKNNEALVKEFAGKMNLEVDDSVMNQLNANITDMMQENQRQLERTLNESVSASVIDGLKSLAEKMNEAEKEQTFKCVQCDKEFRESTNGDKSCSFHKAEYDSWSKIYRCCGTKNPCEYGKHRAEHHSDYPYGPFFTWARNITWYLDTRENWVELKDTNLETEDEEMASISKLLKWQTKGGRIEQPTFLIQVGELRHNTSYLFKAYNAKDLEVITKVVDITHEFVIFRNSLREDEFSMAEWVLNAEGIITGVRLTVKVATAEKPFVRVCPLDIKTADKAGEIIAVSEGGLRSYTPATTYVVPETKTVSDTIDIKSPRELRTDFKTRTSASLPVVLKTTSEPPLVANPRYANPREDRFEGTLSVFNKHAAGSNNPISISSVTAFYRLVGDKEYKKAKAVELIDQTTLPFTVDPRQTAALKFAVNVPRSEEDAKQNLNWFDRAFVARRRPLRLKLVLTDVEEEECSTVIEYICPQYKLQQKSENDIGFFYIDDAKSWSRHYVNIEKKNEGEIVLKHTKLDVTRMQKVVYKALKSGESEVDLEIGEKDTSQEYEWKAWALVDLSCRRLYAFKILLTKGIQDGKGLACLGYALNPPYGDVIEEKRPVMYAKEKISFPEIGEVVQEEEVWDDDFDDFVPEPSRTALPSSTASMPVGTLAPTSPIQLVLPEELDKRLASMDKRLDSMDSNLSRIASVMEQLLEIMRSK